MPTATHLSTPDLGIVAFYLIAITLFGLRFAKRGKQEKSLKSYFLADNAIPWWAIALSIVSAETSTLTIISIPGVAFAGNLGFLQIVLGYMLGRVVVAFLFLPRYFRGEMLTAYQLIDQRFGAALHKITAGLFLLTRAAAEGVRVFAISIVVSLAIGTGDTLSIAIISALTLLYTFEGGMAAVIWTDVVQMALYVAGTIVALLTLGAHVQGGWDHIYIVGQQSAKFHWLDFSFNLTTSYTFWAGILGGTFLTMASHGTDQLMVQRLLAARNLRESRLALLSSGAVIFLQFTLFLLIGVGLFVFYSGASIHFKTNDYIFPTYIVREMPHGIAGLLIAAILAAAMSNLSAALNSLASTTVIDFYVPFRKPKTSVILSGAQSAQSKNPEEASITSTARTFQPSNQFVSRLATLFWAIILFLIAVYSVQHGGKGHVVETGLSIASVAYGCLLGVFLLGTLTRYATQTGAIIGMITGFLTNLFLYQATFPQPLIPLRLHIAFTWYVLIGAVVTFAIGTLFSVILPHRKRTPIITAAAVLFLLSFPQGICFPSAQAQQPPTNNEQRTTNNAPYDFTPVSTLINEAIAAKKLPGAVVLIGHDGQIVFHHAYGLRKLAGEPGLNGQPSPAEPMTEDTIFDMASLTKVIVTTTAILQLYEQGKLSLDTPVAKYLPEFASTTGNASSPTNPSSGQNLLSSRSAAEGSASRFSPGSPQTQATTWKSQITIRQLLTHYSGLPEDVSLKDDWGLSRPARAEGVRRAMNSIPYGPPGVTFKYSDINFITLGALVEKLTVPQWSIYADRPTLDIYAAQKIFKPLGMKETRFLAFDKVCGPLKQIPIPWRSQLLGLPVAGVKDFEVDCDQMSWTATNWIERIAPTAHDDESKANPALNPDYDHLLRGTVHDPTTRRMGGVAGHAGLFSTAADMAIFCQALLDKLTKNTGPFPLKQSTLQLATSPQAPATAHADATIFAQDQEPTKGVAQRGLGWDLNTAFSRPRGEIFPITTKDHPGSFGHTGFTGTSLWLDPTSDTYVILLANAIHPRGNPPISPLRGAVATAAARALGLCPPSTICDDVIETPGPATELPTHNPGIPASIPVPPTPPATPHLLSSRSAAEGSAVRISTNSGAPRLASATWASSEARPFSHTPPHPPVILSEAAQSAAQSKNPEAARPTPTAGAFLPATFHRAPPIQAQTACGREPDSMCSIVEMKPSDFPTLTGIDVLEQTHFAALKSLKKDKPITIAVLTNQSGLDSHGNRTIDILLHADPQIKLAKIFTPEHGLLVKQDTDHLTAESDPITHLPVISLYGSKPADRHPKSEDLKDVDAVVIDLQDMGVRFWTYETVLGYFLDASFCGGPAIVVLDRPNPVGGLAVQGNISSTTNYNSYAAIPVRHGLTYGELAKYFYALPRAFADCGIDRPGSEPHFTVVPMQNWTRSEFFTDTHLPFTPPSPNMKTLAATILYPGIGLIDQTNISVGRGTPTPYENIGATWINAQELTSYLTARKIPGITFTATTLAIAETPEKYPGHGQTIPGVHFTITDRAILDTPELGIELLAALHHLYPTQFQLQKAATILANPATLAALESGQDPRTLAATWLPALEKFRAAAAPYLLYH